MRCKISSAKRAPKLIQTGTPEALADADQAFNVSYEKLFYDPENGWIWSHTGFPSLMGWAGELLTVLPPVLEEGQMADIVRTYVSPNS